MTGEAKRRATYQDVLDAPADVVAEAIDGVLYTQPRGRLGHALAATRLGSALDGQFSAGRPEPGGWVILAEPELHLGTEPDIVVPDLAGWRRSRFPSDPKAAFATVAPDWVSEVLSPSTASKGPHDQAALVCEGGGAVGMAIGPRAARA